MGRHQITSDDLPSYIPAIEEYFGADVDYALLAKLNGKPDNAGPDWYGPGKVIETVPTPISGNPAFDRISTSRITYRLNKQGATRNRGHVMYISWPIKSSSLLSLPPVW